MAKLEYTYQTEQGEVLAMLRDPGFFDANIRNRMVHKVGIYAADNKIQVEELKYPETLTPSLERAKTIVERYGPQLLTKRDCPQYKAELIAFSPEEFRQIMITLENIKIPYRDTDWYKNYLRLKALLNAE